MLRNITREELGDLGVARLILELYLDELRYKELHHSISEALRDHGPGFAWQCAKAQLGPWIRGRLHETRRQYHHELFFDRDEIKTRFEGLGYSDIGGRVGKLLDAPDATFEEVIGIIGSELDEENRLTVRRELEGLLRAGTDNELHEEKHTALRRILDVYLKKVGRLQRMDSFKGARASGEGIDWDEYLTYALDLGLEVIDNLPRMGKNALIVTGLLSVLSIPVILARATIASTRSYLKSKNKIETTYHGRIANMYAGIHGNSPLGSVSGDLMAARSNLDYDTWLEPVYCTRTVVDSDGDTTTESYICRYEREYDFPNPGPARDRLENAVNIVRQIDDVDKEERLKLNRLIRESLEISDSLPLDYEIRVYTDIYQNEMDEITVMLNFPQEMYRSHFDAIDPKIRAEFSNSFKNMMVAWLGLTASTVTVGFGIYSGMVGTTLAAMEGWKRRKDRRLEKITRPGAYLQQQESYARAGRRQAMKYQLASRI